MSKFQVGDRVKTAFTDEALHGTLVRAHAARAHEPSLWTVKWDDGEETRTSEGAVDLVAESTPDDINHPAHYTAYPVEVIELTEHMNFCRGNAVKYIARAGLKDPAKEVEDLRKAAWYIQREIDRIEVKG